MGAEHFNLQTWFDEIFLSLSISMLCIYTYVERNKIIVHFDEYVIWCKNKIYITLSCDESINLKTQIEMNRLKVMMMIISSSITLYYTYYYLYEWIVWYGYGYRCVRNICVKFVVLEAFYKIRHPLALWPVRLLAMGVLNAYNIHWSLTGTFSNPSWSVIGVEWCKLKRVCNIQSHYMSIHIHTHS